MLPLWCSLLRCSLLASAPVVYSVAAVRLSLLASALSSLPLSPCFRSLLARVVYSVAAVRLSLLPSALSLLARVVYSVAAVRLSLLASAPSSLPLPPRFRSLLASASAPVVYSVSAVRLSLLASAQVLPPRFRSSGLQRFGCQTLSASVICTFGLQRTIGTRSMERTGGVSSSDTTQETLFRLIEIE